MKTFLKTALIFVFLPVTLLANVVRPAPNFTWQNIDHSTSTLYSLNGRPVILIVTPNVKDYSFRSQLREIQSAYQALGTARVLAFVAFTQSPGRIPSNVPYIIVSNGVRVASSYGITERFGIAFIGCDGNLDYVSNKVVSGQRALDIIRNSFAVQQALRRN
ncbi:MAG: hypothetical protein C5B47_05490 [Verrucomicrobia bacterium]|nr:MAG: hypothetical protein C5B47_05490 [Verrucomicrobiota bacterium]